MSWLVGFVCSIKFYNETSGVVVNIMWFVMGNASVVLKECFVERFKKVQVLLCCGIFFALSWSSSFVTGLK